MLGNRSLNLAILLQRDKERVMRRQTVLAVVQVPSVLKRINEVAPAPAGRRRRPGALLVHAARGPDRHARRRSVPRLPRRGCSPFRVTRNSDLSIDEDEADDLLKTIQKELRRRERGSAVRLEIAHDSPVEIVSFLRQVLRLDEDDVYRVDGPLHLADLGTVPGREELRDLRDEPFSPQIVPPLQEYDDIFRVITSATSCCSTRTSRSRTSSSSSPRPPAIRTCWRSSRPSTAPAPIRPSCVPSSAPPRTASRSRPSSS